MIRLGILALCMTIAACNKKVQNDVIPQIENQEVKEVMHRAIDAAGGWSRWKSIEHISYTKRSVLYEADGSVERDVSELHSYHLIPELSGEIAWKEAGDSYRTMYSANSSFKEINGERIEDSGDSAYKTFMSAYYVLFVPFKLLDPGAHLTYEGIDTLDKGQIVDVIKVTYDPPVDNNHGTNEDWWYFFDHVDGKHIASMVFHAPTYAFLENIEVDENHALRFNSYRKTFRVDSTRNKEYLRGEFYYSDYVVHFHE